MHPFLHSFAGFVAGFVATVVLYPLEVVKTRLQSNDGSNNKRNLHQYNSTYSAFKTILRREGICGFYGGLIPSLIGSSFAQGFYFLTYSFAKDFLVFTSASKSNSYFDQRQNSKGFDESSSKHHLSIFKTLTASAFAGLITSAITNPIQVIKTNMIIQSQNNKKFESNLDCIRYLYRTEGQRGFYKGLIPSLIGVSQGAIQFMIYENLRQRVISSSNNGNQQLSDFYTILMSSSSKTLAVILTYPLQVVKTRLQNVCNTSNTKQTKINTNEKFSKSVSKESLTLLNKNNLMNVCRNILKKEGWNGFYRGLTANIIRVLPGNCITFVVYERMKILFSIYFNTDS